MWSNWRPLGMNCTTRPTSKKAEFAVTNVSVLYQVSKLFLSLSFLKFLSLSLVNTCSFFLHWKGSIFFIIFRWSRSPVIFWGCFLQCQIFGLPLNHGKLYLLLLYIKLSAFTGLSKPFRAWPSLYSGLVSNHLYLTLTFLLLQYMSTLPTVLPLPEASWFPPSMLVKTHLIL